MSDVLARFRAAFSASQESDVELVRGREARRQLILAGAFPTNIELLTGYPVCAGDFERDIKIWASTEALKPYVRQSAALGEQLQAVIDHPCRWTLAAIDVAILDFEQHVRRQYYLALLGDESARWTIVQRLLNRQHTTWLDQLFGTCLSFEIARLRFVGEDHEASIVPPHILQGIDHLGIGLLHDLELDRYHAAVDAVGSVDNDRIDASTEEMPNAEGTIQEMPSGDRPADLKEAVLRNVAVVVPALDVAKAPGNRKTVSSARQSLRDTFSPIGGVALPLVTRGDVGEHRKALTTRSPHLVGVIDIMLGDLAAKAEVRFRSTILVGEPGAGKSALARDICRQLGLPVTVFAAGGVSDGMFAGVSAGYSTAGVSVPLAHIKDSGVANPVVIIDEIDKAGTGKHNGSLTDALLSFLDRGNAASVRDPALEMTVDLSHVNWILTANSSSDIPTPLRDRCRIVEVPNPKWEHVGDLSRSIIADLARERDLHKSWIPPLADDELQILRKAWNGGSIRKLRRVIEVLVDGREHFMSRC